MVVLPPGARTRALAVCTRGIGGARCWWGWWVLVIGAVPVVGVGEVGGEVTWSRTTHELSNFVDAGVLGGSPHGAAEGRVLGAFEPQSNSVSIRKVGAATLVGRR